MPAVSASNKSITKTTARVTRASALLAASLLPDFATAQDLGLEPTKNVVSTLAENSFCSFTNEKLIEDTKNTSVYKSAKPEDQGLIDEVLIKLPSGSKEYFITLLKRTILNGESALFQKDFFRQDRCIDCLDKLLDQKFHQMLEPERDAIIRSLLQELACPGELNQSNWSVCGTSMVYGLFRDYPGEAVRLVSGMILPGGKVPLLKRNNFLTRAPHSLLPDPDGDRSITERLLFAALMDLADGPNESYCNVCDLHFHNRNGSLSSGLSYAQQMALYKSIYNISDDDCFAVSNCKDWSSVEYYFKNYLPGLLPVGLNWSDTSAGLLSAKTHHSLGLFGETKDGHLLDYVTFRTDFTSSHRIDVTKIENNRVYFRNLHGPCTHANGTELVNPPIRVEDNKLGMQSLKLAEFKKRLLHIIVPLRGHRLPEPQYP